MRTLITILLALLYPAVWGLEISTNPGQLASTVSKPAESIESLTVKGLINQDDLKYIADSLGSLRTLDLSDCSIVDAAIADGTFADNNIEVINLPAQPLIIGTGAFMGSALKSIVIPGGSTLGMGAFAACPALELAVLNHIDLSAGYAFKDCQALKQVHCADVKNIGEASFSGCRQLSTITGSGSAATIGPRAFAGCEALEKFEFPATPCSIGEHAFVSSGLQNAVLASGSHIAKGSFFDCIHLSEISLSQGTDSLPPYSLKGAGIEGELILPEGLQHMGEYCLKGASRIEKITLPSSLASVGNHAMDGNTALQTIEAGTLTTVPETGDDVWEGIDASKVNLAVAENMQESFRAANQWQDFNVIISDNGSVRLPIADETVIAADLHGNTLVVEASGADIAQLQLADLAGRVLATLLPCAPSASVSLETLQTQIILVHVVLCNGKCATIKILRHG